VAAVNLVDYYIVRRGHYAIAEIFNPHGMYGRWGWRGIVSYLVGFAAMLPFLSTSKYTGFVANAMGGADISFFIGLPVAGVLYWVLARTIDVEAFVELAEVDEDLGVEGPAGLDDLAQAPDGRRVELVAEEERAELQQVGAVGLERVARQAALELEVREEVEHVVLERACVNGCRCDRHGLLFGADRLPPRRASPTAGSPRGRWRPAGP